MSRPEAFTRYGAVELYNGQAARMERIAAGVLDVSSGALGISGICTGEWSPKWDPYVEVPNGPYEVALSQVRWPDDRLGEMRGVAAVTIRASHQSVERWAPWPGSGGGHAVVIEYGIGAVFDSSKAPIADGLCSDPEELIVEPLFEYTTDPWYMWHQGVLAFRGGRGDGAYDVWIGYGEENRATALAIDLELLG